MYGSRRPNYAPGDELLQAWPNSISAQDLLPPVFFFFSAYVEGLSWNLVSLAMITDDVWLLPVLLVLGCS